MPTFFFMTLSYCFFFSFYRVATHSVAPTTWPAAWLVFIVVFFLNPLPIIRRRSRYWFLHVLWRVITPGYSRVEVSSRASEQELTPSSLLSSSPTSSTVWSTPFRTSTSYPVSVRCMKAQGTALTAQTATIGQTMRTVSAHLAPRGRTPSLARFPRSSVSSSV